jgi:hypothetical protein
VRKDFKTQTVRLCPESGSCTEENRLPATEFDDFIESAITVPGSGRFEWHVGPSTRPYVASGGGTEAWVLTCEAPGGAVLSRRDIVVARGEKLTFENACDQNAPFASSPSAAPDPLPGSPGVPGSTGTAKPDQKPAAPRAMRLFVGPRRVPRFQLRRRGYLRVAMKVSGATVSRLRVRFLDADRDVLATRSFRRLAGRKAIRLRLGRRIPPRGLYRLSLRGVADNGAPVGTAVRLRIVGR